MAKTKQKKTKTSLQPRSPVVSILGHIDHGKTTLLDSIRKTNTVASEAGGITQHIGAYQIEFKGKKITFIDTPGHAAFAQMRARGAKVTDLAVLVVAADEGVKPQTKESLKFIRQAKIPFLIAATKIDLESSDLEKVAGQLSKEGVLVEKKGGKIVFIPLSAKTGKGVEDLLEMILLLAEMEALKANLKGEFKGVVIESKLDRSRGPLATILVEDGTLSVADPIWAEKFGAKVKAMYDENGQKVLKAFPGKPIEVLGFKSVPPVGAKVAAFPVESKMAELKRSEPPPKEEDDDESQRKLKLILKADTRGTLEAVALNLPKEVELIYQGVGDINESDVLFAQTTKAKLVGFNVSAPDGVRKLAQIEKVKIKTYKVIYELLEEIEKETLKILKPSVDEEVLGEAEILREFLVNEKIIAGCRVLRGQVARGHKVHLKRGEKILRDTQVRSLKQGKKDIDFAKAGEELGVAFTSQFDFKIGDMLISFRKLPQEE